MSHCVADLIQVILSGDIRTDNAFTHKLLHFAKDTQHGWDSLPAQPIGEPEPFDAFAAINHEARIQFDWLIRQYPIEQGSTAFRQRLDRRGPGLSADRVHNKWDAVAPGQFMHPLNQWLVRIHDAGVAAERA